MLMTMKQFQNNFSFVIVLVKNYLNLCMPFKALVYFCFVAHTEALKFMNEPACIIDSCCPVSTPSTWSSIQGELFIPRKHTKFGDCDFSVAGPNSRNTVFIYLFI